MKLTLLIGAILLSSTAFAETSTSQLGQGMAAKRVLMQVDCKTGEPVLDSAGKRIELVEDAQSTSTSPFTASDKPKECARRSPTNNGCSGGECTSGTCKETGTSMTSCKCFN